MSTVNEFAAYKVLSLSAEIFINNPLLKLLGVINGISPSSTFFTCRSPFGKEKSKKSAIGNSLQPDTSIDSCLDRLTASNKYIYAQVIDDTKGITLVQASSLDPALKGQLDEVDKSGEAKLVGKLVAERAKQAGVEKVVFDRGGYVYTGRVAALAAGAREAGLEF